jgi:hypothetical protein
MCDHSFNLAIRFSSFDQYSEHISHNIELLPFGVSRSYDGSFRSGASSSWYPDLSVPQQYHDLCKRVCEAWVVEITNRNTHKRIRIWINTFYLAAQMAKVHDIESVHLYGSDTKLNFELGSPD